MTKNSPQHGFVHGDVLPYLADNALTVAGGSVPGAAVTAEHKINYFRPAADAQRLVAVANLLMNGPVRRTAGSALVPPP